MQGSANLCVLEQTYLFIILLFSSPFDFLKMILPKQLSAGYSWAVCMPALRRWWPQRETKPFWVTHLTLKGNMKTGTPVAAHWFCFWSWMSKKTARKIRNAFNFSFNFDLTLDTLCLHGVFFSFQFLNCALRAHWAPVITMYGFPCRDGGFSWCVSEKRLGGLKKKKTVSLFTFTFNRLIDFYFFTQNEIPVMHLFSLFQCKMLVLHEKAVQEPARL